MLLLNRRRTNFFSVRWILSAGIVDGGAATAAQPIYHTFAFIAAFYHVPLYNSFTLFVHIYGHISSRSLSLSCMQKCIRKIVPLNSFR